MANWLALHADLGWWVCGFVVILFVLDGLRIAIKRHKNGSRT